MPVSLMPDSVNNVGYTTVENDLCTTCYERPPVLRDRFCWAEGVVAQDRFYCIFFGVVWTNLCTLHTLSNVKNLYMLSYCFDHSLFYRCSTWPKTTWYMFFCSQEEGLNVSPYFVSHDDEFQPLQAEHTRLAILLVLITITITTPTQMSISMELS